MSAALLFPLKTTKNENPATEVFTLDGSIKTNLTNVLGRASTTLPKLALTDVISLSYLVFAQNIVYTVHSF